MSPQQLFMLRMFDQGWGFRLFNERRGSWNTYWSLKRSGYIKTKPAVEHAGKPVVMAELTERGKRAIMQEEQ